MIPAAIVMATVADPTQIRTSAATTKATTTIGRFADATAFPITSPSPEYCSMYRSTPPQAVTRRISPVGSKDFVITFSKSSSVYPCRSPRIAIAATVAIRSATKGSPKNANTGASPPKAGTTPETESRIINIRGIRIIPTIVQKLGSLDSSKSSWFATCSGTGILYRLPQIEPHMGPAAIIATTPHAIPTRITQPSSTPSRFATSTGPGVGGI